MTVSYLPTHVDDLAPAGCVTSQHLVHRSGITYRQLDYWTRTGLLEPLPRPPLAGSGFARYFRSSQVAKASTIALLLESGISLQTIRVVVDELLEVGHVRLHEQLTIHLPIEP